MKHVLVCFFCSLALACSEPDLSLSDLAGVWQVENWPLSNEPGDVGTVYVRFSPAQGAALFTQVPDNDWGYTEGDVAFYDFEAFDQDAIRARTRLRYFDGPTPDAERTVTIERRTNELLNVWGDCNPCNIVFNSMTLTR